MKLSIVIATKDRAAYLDRALASLAAQRGAPPFEVIVVDNGSRDATAEVARRHAPALDLQLVREPQPNRGRARNAGVRAASGTHVVFVDDDVALPAGFLAAHGRAHAERARRGRPQAAISGPILNVPSYDDRPAPAGANYSGAFFCTCNVSVARAALERSGGFDERFDLYGWEDTELGLRLRGLGLRRAFAWPAYLYHIKPPRDETLEVVLRKTLERARMAARLLALDGGLRATLATGAYPLNVARSRLLAPGWSLPWYAGLATSPRVGAAVRALARAQLLDGAYVAEMRRARAALARPRG